jgi:hypothetical protein
VLLFHAFNQIISPGRLSTYLLDMLDTFFRRSFARFFFQQFHAGT